MKATREVCRGRERDMGAAHTERTRSPSLKPVARIRMHLTRPAIVFAA